VASSDEGFERLGDILEARWLHFAAAAATTATTAAAAAAIA